MKRGKRQPLSEGQRIILSHHNILEESFSLPTIIILCEAHRNVQDTVVKIRSCHSKHWITGSWDIWVWKGLKNAVKCMTKTVMSPQMEKS